jgi:hypothetical protein
MRKLALALSLCSSVVLLAADMAALNRYSPRQDAGRAQTKK